MQASKSNWAALSYAAPFLLALALLFFPAPEMAAQQTAVAYPQSMRWVGGEYDGRRVQSLTLPTRTGRIAVTFDLPAETIAAGPLGLRLAGPFSATATWNGVPIGAKGTPAARRELERPGPIDAEFAIPAELLHPGANTLELDVSAHWLSANGWIIHGPEGLSVQPYSADARRPLHAYLLPLVMIGVLLAALALIVRRADARWPAAFICGLLIVAIAEISRAFVNYPYPLHAWRAASQFAGCAIAAVAMVNVAAERAGLRERRDLVIVLSLLIALIGVGATTTDPRAVNAISVGALAALMTIAPVAQRGAPDAIRLSLALVLLAAFSFLDSRDFLDRALYAAALPLIANFPLAAFVPASNPDRLLIGAAKRRRVAALADIRAIHAADKYAEFELVSGERVLDERTLSDWVARLPKTFIRTHRSHIVNVARVSGLLVLGPGKYAAEMDDCSQVPLSRTNVARVRALLGGDGLSPAPDQG